MSMFSDIPPNYVYIAGFFMFIGLLIGYVIASWRTSGPDT